MVDTVALRCHRFPITANACVGPIGKHAKYMRTQYDLTKANAVINEYVAAVSDKNQVPSKHNRTWLEFCMQRNGLIPDVRQLAFMESHALWYACLVITGRVREVSRIEAKNNHKAVRTTEATITRCFSNKYPIVRDSLTAHLLREIIQKNKS